ncbi:unnamed protein product, partial [Prunus brigantina]
LSDRKEWQHSYQPTNYNGYDSYGSNSQSISQYYGQYNFTHQGGPNTQYGSSSQFGGQYGGHNYVGGFGDQYSGLNYIGRYDVMNQNGSNDQNGFGGQTNQNGYSGQEMPYVDRMDKEHQNVIKEIFEVKDLFMEMAVSNELLVQHLREISMRLAIEEQGQTFNPNLNSQSQKENSHVVASRPPIPPTPLEESEVSREYKNEKEMGETMLGSNVQVDHPIESLTLVKEKEYTQGDETQKMATDENCNMVQPKATILGCNNLPPSEEGGQSTTQGGIIIDMIVGEKLDIARPQLQQEQNGPGRNTAVGHDQVVVEDITEVAGGPVLRPNPATSLELQQLMRVMETMAQTMATQNAQINERFDRWLGQQNGQNGNQGAPIGAPAVGPQVEAQPNAHQGAGANFAGPHINRFGVGGWNNPGGNANNPLLGNQAIDRGAVEQMIQDMVPHARRIGRPVYRRPYPEHFGREEFPRGFKVPNFALFSGDGLQSTVEHIGRFIAQCAEIGHREALKLRLFPSTLTGATFSWYVKLPQNSVPNWQVREQVFHEQFYRPEPEVSMADLAKISQKSSESVQEYLGRFREARARCTKFEGIGFRDIYDLLLRVDRYEALLKEEQQKGRPAPRPTFYRDSTKPSGSRTTAVHAVDIGDIDSEERGDEVYLEEEEESAEVNLAEIVAKGLYVCKALSKASKDQRPTTAQMSKFSGTSK